MPIFQHDLPKPPRVRKPTVAEVAQFGGLNLAADPQEIGWQGAIDLLNVDLDRSGRIRQRDGYATFATAPAAPRSLGSHPDQVDPHLLAGYRNAGNADIRAINSLGGTVATLVAGAAGTGRASFAPIGVMSGATEMKRTYVSADNITGTLWRYDGAAFTSFVPAAGATGGGPLCVQPTDNRLVSALGSRVYFSDAGAPETFGTNNYVTLTPGDGEQIIALASYGTYVFAFKQTKFFVFHGNSTDASGNPVFNYRSVDDGVGVVFDSTTNTKMSQAVAVGRDGVYFVHSDGIYRTTGGSATRISEAIDPLFDGLTAQPSGLEPVDGVVKLAIAGDHLAFSYETAAVATRTLLYDLRDHRWTRYSLGSGAGGMEAMTPYFDQGRRLAFVRDTGKIYEMSSAYTNDDGEATDSRYTTGFSDLGTPGTEKILREILLDGIGNVTVGVALNDSTTYSAGTTVALGTSPAIAQGRYRTSARARNISLRFADVNGGAWNVSRAVALVRGERPAGLRSTS